MPARRTRRRRPTRTPGRDPTAGVITSYSIHYTKLYDYGPSRAGEYFKKVECFCFEQQTLAAGEVRRMPVVFVVDPSLPKDVTTITLSYTFFEVAGRGGKS